MEEGSRETVSVDLHSRTSPPFTKRNRKFFSGSNKGSVLGPLKVLPWTDGACWRLPSEQFGKDHIVLVGGAVSDEIGDAKVITFDDHMDPVFCHFNNPLLYAELLRSYKPAAVVRAPEADHCMAMECIKAQVPLVSICLSPAHAELLKSQILKKMWAGFLDESSDLYEASLLLACVPCQFRT